MPISPQMLAELRRRGILKTGPGQMVAGDVDLRSVLQPVNPMPPPTGPTMPPEIAAREAAAGRPLLSQQAIERIQAGWNPDMSPRSQGGTDTARGNVQSDQLGIAGTASGDLPGEVPNPAYTRGGPAASQGAIAPKPPSGEGAIQNTGAAPQGHGPTWGGGGTPGTKAYESLTSSPQNIEAIHQARQAQAAGVQEEEEAQAGGGHARSTWGGVEGVRKKGTDELAADAMKGIQMQREADEADFKSKELDRQRILQRYNRAQDAREKYAEEHGKTDPEHWAKTRTPLKRALNIIGDALQMSFGHGQSIIRQAIDADIRSQEGEIANRNKAVEQGRTGLREMVNQFGDARAGEAAYRLQLSDLYKSELQQFALRTQSPILQARAHQQIAELALKDAEDRRAMTAWHPATAGGASGPDMRKQYTKERENFAEKHPGEAFPSYGQWLPYATGAGGVTPGAPAGGAGPLPPEPKSTAYDPTRIFQGTGAFNDTKDQEAWNLAVMSGVRKKLGERVNPDTLREVAGAYNIEPGDTESTVRNKIARFKRDFPRTGGAAPAGPQITPAGEGD